LKYIETSILGVSVGFNHKEGGRMTSVHEAAGKGDLEAVKSFVEQDVTCVNQEDQYNWRPIFQAALHKRYNVVKYLIDQGADLAAMDGYVMHFAGEVPNNKEILTLLVTYGGLDSHTKPNSEIACQFIYAIFLANESRVDVMLREDFGLVHELYARGDTALHHAARNGDLEIVKILVSRGANVNVFSDDRQFPLYCAAGHGHLETTKFLVENGADLQAQMKDGKTVIEWLGQYSDDTRLKPCLDFLVGLA
jgi:ankyrin repeat protein